MSQFLIPIYLKEMCLRAYIIKPFSEFNGFFHLVPFLSDKELFGHSWLDNGSHPLFENFSARVFLSAK